jgi:hypothetical protein
MITAAGVKGRAVMLFTMKTHLLFAALMSLLASAVFVAGCTRKEPAATPASVAKHQHNSPHGGTAVVLGDEMYHLEFVRDPTEGKLDAYVFDGEMENFIRIPALTIELRVSVVGAPATLVLQGVANPMTGETAGDTSQFSAQADWLKVTPAFDAVLRSITIRGTTFTDVKFNFPKGNDKE